MSGTGLRLRFFLIILAVLVVVTAAALSIHTLYIKQERLRLIDDQVRETAAALLDSELGGLRNINFDYAEDIISEELGESRIGKFFIIRDSRGKVIFESTSAQVLNLDQLDRSQQWSHFNRHGKYIRVLNLKLPRVPDRTLQTGVVVDEDLLTPNYLSRSSIVFMGIILALGLAASQFLTSFLLKPIVQLEGFLSTISEQAQTQPQLPNIPPSILPNPKSNPKDEFTRLLVGLNGLIDKINRNYRFSRLWAYQMAHELKTPLSILNLVAEKLQKQPNVPGADIHALVTEGTKISETINSFLGWAELENSTQQRHLFANRLGNSTRTIVQRLDTSHPGRLRIDQQADPIVFANPQHLEQLISNIVSNALTYSPPNQPVTIRVSLEDTPVLTVIDQGSGIPGDVIERLGEPFNRGDSTQGQARGHGLGLAWVKSICRHYSWPLDIQSTEAGSILSIHFPKISEES